MPLVKGVLFSGGVWCMTTMNYFISWQWSGSKKAKGQGMVLDIAPLNGKQ